MDGSSQPGNETSFSATSSARTKSRKQQRRSIEERRRIVEATLAAGASVPRIAEAHGIRASQVFHWRKLYREGRLNDTGTSTAKLVPVTLADALPGEPIGGADGGLPGTLCLELPHAGLRLEGRVDPVSLRLVLEWLRR